MNKVKQHIEQLQSKLKDTDKLILLYRDGDEEKPTVLIHGKEEELIPHIADVFIHHDTLRDLFIKTQDFFEGLLEEAILREAEAESENKEE